MFPAWSKRPKRKLLFPTKGLTCKYEPMHRNVLPFVLRYLFSCACALQIGDWWKFLDVTRLISWIMVECEACQEQSIVLASASL